MTQDRTFSQSYYDVGNGKQILDYVYEYNLGFSFGNAAKYLVRAGRKDNNSADSDLNKALNYVVSSKEEFSFIKRLFMRFFNTLSFEDNFSCLDKNVACILKSIIKFDKPDSIAKMIVKYAVDRGIRVNPEYMHYYSE